MSPLVLVVQHEDQCPPGLLGPWLNERGVRLDVVLAHRGELVPAALTGHDALLVLGGEMGALDDDLAPWLPRVRRLIAQTVRAGHPYLGVCLGHQLAGVALGGTLARNPAGRARGVTPVAPTPAGRQDPLLSAVAPGAPAVQWNGDVLTTLPPAAVPLAHAPDGSVQAARFGPLAWGVQPHPEATAAIFRSWTTQHPSATVPRGEAAELAAVAQEIEDRGSELAAAWEGFGHRFAEIVTTAAAVRSR